MSKRCKIYGLADPDTGEVVYVGKTEKRLCERYATHKIQMKLEPNHPKSLWLKRLLELNKRPDIILLEEVDWEIWEDREKYWISHFKQTNNKLTNLNEGGSGNLGYFPTEESKLKMSLSAKEAWKTKNIGDKTRCLQNLALGSLQKYQSKKANTIRKTKRNNLTGYKGVRALRGKFQAYINYKGRQICLSVFDTAKEAAIVRDRKAYQLFGNEVYLNFPELIVQ